MDRFARLFTLQFQLGDAGNHPVRIGRDAQWRAIDRTIVLFGPPAIVNKEWCLGHLDLPVPEEDLQPTASMD
ncbi:MAG: hypothetical protein HQL96_12275 [Magnetococcales bacterium]|nr:hypothetical protein [Magnetococcales bacterium]